MTSDDKPSCGCTDLPDTATLVQEFGEEALEHLDEIEPDLLALEKDPAHPPMEVINRLFRAIHSIKGSSALVGLSTLRDFSHLMENALLRMRNGELSPTPERIDVLLAAVDKLRQLIQAGADQQVDLSRESQLLAALQAAATRAAQPAPPAVSPTDWETATGVHEESDSACHPASNWVLVVEDNKVTARLLRDLIAAQTNFHPLVAHSLAEARQALEADRDRFFVSLLDLNLPDALDGEVVDLAIAHRLPAIILTATFDEGVRERILAKRVVDYVVKGGSKDLDYVVHLLNRLEKNKDIKVLVAEDTRGIRENIKMLLRLHRYQVVTAGDGEEALEMMTQHADVRVVITDFNMPRMDGLQLVARLRDRYHKDRLAIIGMSAEGAGTLSAKFLKTGANDFLPKPFLNEEFHCRVNQNVELLELIGRMQEASHRDFLTNLYNRRFFFNVGEQMHRQALDGGRHLAVGMIDIDFFKKVNDQYGHAAGDQALRHLSGLLCSLFPDPALVARLGGEEFCVLLTDVDRQHALLRFNELRKAVERTPVRVGDCAFGLTISIGLITDGGKGLEEMLRRADDLLYQAKAKGRNRVVTHA